MKAGWKTVKLADVAEMRPPKSEAKLKGLKPTDEVGFLPMEDLTQFQKHAKALKTRTMSEVSNSYTYFANGDVLMAKISPCFQNGKMGIATGLPNGVGYGSSEYFVFRPSKELSAEWLFYYLQDPAFRRHATGKFSGNVGQQRLPKELIEELEIPLPPLAEQKRIVAQLDKAFAGIDEAKVRAEESLQNALNVFESYLAEVFNNRGIDWVEQPFEGCIDEVKYTTKIQRKDFMDQGRFPIISQEAEFINGYWDNDDDVFHVTTPVVVFGDHSKVLKYIDFNFVLGADGVKILQPKPAFLAKFFFYQIRNIRLKSLGYARHYRLLKEERLTCPNLNEQQAIAARLDALSVETQLLTQLYKRKIEAQEELKASLLAQAFAGELTA